MNNITIPLGYLLPFYAFGDQVNPLMIKHAFQKYCAISSVLIDYRLR